MVQLPINKKELETWRAFHSESHANPEFEALITSRNRIHLLEEYYKKDPVFRKTVNSLAKKIKSHKIKADVAIGEFDNLLTEAEARLIAETTEESRREFLEEERRMLKLHHDLHS